MQYSYQSLSAIACMPQKFFSGVACRFSDFGVWLYNPAVPFRMKKAASHTPSVLHVDDIICIVGWLKAMLPHAQAVSFLPCSPLRSLRKATIMLLSSCSETPTRSYSPDRCVRFGQIHPRVRHPA